MCGSEEQSLCSQFRGLAKSDSPPSPPPSDRAALLVPVFTPRVRQVNQLLVVATKSASENEYKQCIKLTSGG